MQATRDAGIVVCLVVLSLTPVMVGLLTFPTQSGRNPLAQFCPWNPSPYYNSVNLTPQSPVLLPGLDQHNAGRGDIGFHLDASADFSGAWVATAPVDFGVGNLDAPLCGGGRAPGPAQLNGTFNISLFPGNYVMGFGYSYVGGAPTITATQPWMVTFDRTLEVLQSPKDIGLAPNGYAAWTISAPSDAARFFVEYGLVTSSCSFELAMLPPANYRAFVSGHGPLNAHGTEAILNLLGSSCGLASGPAEAWCETGPFNWTSSDVVVFFNGDGDGAGLNFFSPLEVSYLSG